MKYLTRFSIFIRLTLDTNLTMKGKQNNQRIRIFIQLFPILNPLYIGMGMSGIPTHGCVFGYLSLAGTSLSLKCVEMNFDGFRFTFTTATTPTKKESQTTKNEIKKGAALPHLCPL